MRTPMNIKTEKHLVAYVWLSNAPRHGQVVRFGGTIVDDVLLATRLQQECAVRVVLRCRRDEARAGERALQQKGALVLLVPVLVLELHTCTVTTNGADQRLYTEAITRSDSSVSSLTKNM